MDLEHFLTVRPYAYHLTARRNIRGICHHRALLSASNLANGPSEKATLAERRVGCVEFGSAHIRDQKPLYRGNIEFALGFRFEQLLDLLNSLVFFWPGPRLEEKGPIDYGWRHFGRYKSESPIMLRVPTSDLVSENGQQALVCRYNSGSPRCSHGRKSPRGPETFLPVDQFPETASKVVEVVFKGKARLPATTEKGDTPSGPWFPLL